MKAKGKVLKQYSSLWVFSIIILICIVVSSCCYNVEADYSFHNNLNHDVELSLYNRGPNLSGNISYQVKAGESVMIASLETCDRSGFGDVIVNEVDSAMLILTNTGVVISKWRNSGEYYLLDGYESISDFFNYWSWEKNRIQRGSSHAEYRYILELAEK